MIYLIGSTWDNSKKYINVIRRILRSTSTKKNIKYGKIFHKNSIYNELFYGLHMGNFIVKAPQMHTGN